MEAWTRIHPGLEGYRFPDTYHFARGCPSSALADDAATIERIARERYGMIKPGERLYRFVEGDSTTMEAE